MRGFASTALAAGVALMGETCAAVTGGIMAIGLVLGIEDLADIRAYRESMQASYEMYGRFKEELGSTNGSNYETKPKEKGKETTHQVPEYR
jgi:C_GCAxxG_C_C family probable redox protein